MCLDWTDNRLRQGSKFVDIFVGENQNVRVVPHKPKLRVLVLFASQYNTAVTTKVAVSTASDVQLTFKKPSCITCHAPL